MRILVVLAAAGVVAGFGTGRHACPGSSLALAVAASAIRFLAGEARALLERSAPAGYRPSVNVRIPVFSPADASTRRAARVSSS